jgi:hypothetical protein
MQKEVSVIRSSMVNNKEVLVSLVNEHLREFLKGKFFALLALLANPPPAQNEPQTHGTAACWGTVVVFLDFVVLEVLTQ